MNRTELIGHLQTHYALTAEEVTKIENDSEKMIQTIFDMNGFNPGVDISELVDGAFGGNLSNRDYLKDKSAVRIKTNGIVDDVIPRNGSDFSLEEMYTLINTDIIETVYLPGDKVMIVDEEGGLRTDRKVNWMATKIVTDIELKIGRIPTFIFGDVMIINQSQIK